MSEKILERIKKLLRIADPSRGASQQEQETAALAAQRLALEHNLHLDTIGDLDASERRDEQIEQDSVVLTGGHNLSWQKHLLWQVCQALLVKACYSAWQKSMWLVGKKTNTEIVKYLFGYLTRAIEALGKEHVVEQRELAKALMVEFPGHEARQAYYSFCMGACGTIGRRLMEQYQRVTRSTASSTALVVQSEAALEAAFKQFFPRTTKTRISSGRDSRSRAAGAEAARNIPLHAGVGQGGAGQRRLS